eukprot:TRINITY_DN3131_c0_g1_i2.p1 TRINITY_DN3131_c0_g1~~TRINITY_DN3131_c0_g1_i2.p1  ORF type:complete len:239 (+),score=37.69 TRINITY_DN3131_c0_g1_i2:188-904(+)
MKHSIFRRPIVVPKIFQEKYKSVLIEKRKAREKKEASELISEFSSLFRKKLRAGFETDKQILRNACEELLEEKKSVSKYKKVAKKILEYEIKIFEIEQQTWPSETDFDRLEKVYTDLESQKILCRHNYGYTGYEGNTRLKGEYEEIVKKGGDPPIGYVFYHKQDTEFLINPNPADMLFNYGSFKKSDDKSMLAIGKKLADCLRKHGFVVDWDETLAKRVSKTMLWRKRRVGTQGSHRY